MAGSLILCALVSLLSVSLVAQQIPQAAGSNDHSVAGTQFNPSPPNSDDHILEDGTPVKLRLTQSFNSATARTGQEIPFEVMNDIDVHGVTVVRKGAKAVGIFTEAEPGKRKSREGKLSFRLSYVRLTDGENAPLRATGHTSGRSNPPGSVIMPPPSRPGLPANVAAADAGAAMGVDVAAAALLFLITKGQDASIPQGTKITAFINGDLTLDPAKFGAESPPAAQASAQASLVVESTPSGADVMVDGAPVGNTPLTVAVTPGSHRVLVKKKGFSDWTKAVTVTGSVTHVNAQLEQVSAQ